MLTVTLNIDLDFLDEEIEKTDFGVKKLTSKMALRALNEYKKQFGSKATIYIQEGMCGIKPDSYKNTQDEYEEGWRFMLTDLSVNLGMLLSKEAANTIEANETFTDIIKDSDC